jgi:tRNA/tmRNA/rRNA uracil-C5-methylase (TrmA/RlmC/RlmD family)
VEDARHNLADFDRVRIEQGKVESVLPRTGIDEVDLIVLDPPRAGARAQIEALADGPPRIAYASCHPGSFARDAALLAARGWRLAELRPIDQFLYSAEVELVALFRRGPPPEQA